ncbi:DUF559 domain-containing protein [Nocardioides abyssi]|uniref:DUF559 domain-containing protein n=1 Tax=Nocardioides abyssi TaxID=3058370 RepID=A0ABT8EPN2_9ACTN|nr:DUF559 domain-containing protein [Nocardioides abyssi]MDN4160112.1 DUF559 domain-containing protein [Nocardioides abyssi]
MPDVVELLADLGGVARRGVLLAVVDRGSLEASVAGGSVVRVGRGLYALPGADDAVRVAAHLGGVVSHTNAALQHGWGVKTLPDRPHVVVPRGRKVGRRRALAHVHYADLAPGDVVDGVTSPAVTLRHCLRALPVDEALAVADSALRESGCHRLLEEVAEEARGPGAPRVRRIADLATELAANPFESVLRAICLEVPGLEVRPQVTITDGGFRARADLADERLRIVCEADSFAWHGSRSALASDARRYNRMVVAGWIVLRFTYEDVMFHPEEVRAVLLRAVALAEVLVEVGSGGGAAA